MTSSKIYNVVSRWSGSQLLLSRILKELWSQMLLQQAIVATTGCYFNCSRYHYCWFRTWYASCWRTSRIPCSKPVAALTDTRPQQSPDVLTTIARQRYCRYIQSSTTARYECPCCCFLITCCYTSNGYPQVLLQQAIANPSTTASPVYLQVPTSATTLHNVSGTYPTLLPNLLLPLLRLLLLLPQLPIHTSPW